MSNSNIIKAIETYVDTKINNAGFDKTKVGIIIKGNSNNTYTIQMDGIEYSGVRSVCALSLNEGDTVKVYIPNNQVSQMYIDSSCKVESSGGGGSGAINTITGNAPISVSGTDSDKVISHGLSGVSSGTYGNTRDVELKFGESFKLPNFTVDDKGHINSAYDRIITLPTTGEPISSKIYQNVIATSNTQALGTFYCLSVMPDNYYEPCRIKIRVRAYINEESTNANKDNFYEETISELCITGTSLSWYRNQNAIYSTSYRPYYYITTYRATKTGLEANHPHYVGVSLYNATSPTTATLKRDIVVELLEVENCTATLLDELILQSNFVDGTNYTTGITNTDATSMGTKQTGDNNSIDRLQYGSFSPKAKETSYGTQLVLSLDGKTYFSICNSRSVATTKTCTTMPFRPEHILYYANSNTISTNSNFSAGYMYEAIPFDARYSHNLGSTLVAQAPAYLKCTYSNGGFYLDSTNWFTQAEPTEEDGFYYIFIGYAYSTTAIALKPVHTVYKFVNGRFSVVEPNVVESIGTATQTNNGLMSSSDKSKLDGVQNGATKVHYHWLFIEEGETVQTYQLELTDNLIDCHAYDADNNEIIIDTYYSYNEGYLEFSIAEAVPYTIMICIAMS